MKKISTFLALGMTGLPIVAALNLFALTVMQQPAAAFFSKQWWPTLFTSYTIWGVFLVIGLFHQRIRQTNNDSSISHSLPPS